MQDLDIRVLDRAHAVIMYNFENIKLRNFLVWVSVEQIKSKSEHVHSVSHDHLNLRLKILIINCVCKIQEILHFFCYWNPKNLSHKLFESDFWKPHLRKTFDTVFST